MIRILADENFNNHILKGLVRLNPDVEIVRVQDTEMYTKPDPDLLAWAAEQGYVLVSHDYRTIPKFANDRIEANLPMMGVIMAHRNLPLRQVIDDLLVFIIATEPEEWVNRMEFLPL